MWKYASRSIKSIFCKNQQSHNNISARAARNDNKINSFINLPPASLNIFNRHYGETRDHSQFSENDKKENPKTNNRSFLHDFQCGISCALRWIGIFGIGWYLIQPFAHRKAAFNFQSLEKYHFYLSTKFTCNEYSKLLNYLKNSFDPLHFAIPIVKAQNSSKKDNLDDSQDEEVIGRALEKAHLKVLGAFSNFRGAHCMESGRYSEALRHFQEAARVFNPAGIFNLGVCHELGLGTARDVRKAAELYRQASDLGHPTATYNLGVFYVKGWGNLETDMNEARKLFKKAANLGQPDAKAALDLEKDNLKISSEDDNFEKTKNNSSKHVEDKLKEGKIINFNFSKILTCEMNNSDDSGALDLSPEVVDVITR